MYDFFAFILYAGAIFLLIWFLGMNLFKFSGNFFRFLDIRAYKKTLKSYAHEKEDFQENYKKSFGLVESVEYIAKRQCDIRQLLKTSSGKVSLTAVELIFLLDELEEVQQLDDGTYLIAKGQLEHLFLDDVDKLEYIKKLKVIVERFMPKEGESISLDASDLFQQIRQGRFNNQEGNQLFSVERDKSSDFIGTLKESLYDQEHKLQLISEESRVEEKDLKEAEAPLKKDTYIEGQQVVWSDSTLRTKMGNSIIVQHADGKIEKLDMKGNVLEKKREKEIKTNLPKTFEKSLKKTIEDSLDDVEETQLFMDKKTKHVKKKSTLVKK